MSNHDVENPVPPKDAKSDMVTDEPLSLTMTRLGVGRPRLRWVKWAVGLAILVFVVWFVPPVYRLKSGPVTVTRYTKQQGEVQATVGPQVKGWTSTKKISRHTLNAIVSAEDGKFYYHRGLDAAEILSSLRTNWQKKRYARGGSTITQQVVKMAFLGREKTLIRKAREAVGALLLELILSKDKILEWYINLAEFGDGVYGVEKGAWHYFKTKPELLAVEESVHLALVLPSPNAWSKGLRRRNLTPFGQRRFATILNRMRQSGYITKPQWIAAITRGDFGRPVTGYASLLAAEEKNTLLCPGNPGCPEGDEGDLLEEELDELSFPKKFPGLSESSSPSMSSSTSTGDSYAPENSSKDTEPKDRPLPGLNSLKDISTSIKSTGAGYGGGSATDESTTPDE